MFKKSFLDKTFIIESKEARIRQEKDLLKYTNYEVGDEMPTGKAVGQPKIITAGTKVKITNAKSIDSKLTFVLTEPESPGAKGYFGWTSADNLKGKFINETIGKLEPSGTDKKGLNAAWNEGKYIGQKTLVEIIGSKNETERIILDVLDPYLALVNAAVKDGITIALNSGFRTYPEQQYLYNLHQQNPKKYATAAVPGTSNHQDGMAFDLAVGGYDGNPVYDWLKASGPRFGFIRTVNKEPWHWEYRPTEAAALAAKGKFKTAKVKV